MLEGCSGSTKLVRMPFLASDWERRSELVLPKVLRQGMALPIPHIEICSGVTAIISWGITYDGITSRERNR